MPHATVQERTCPTLILIEDLGACCRESASHSSPLRSEHIMLESIWSGFQLYILLISSISISTNVLLRKLYRKAIWLWRFRTMCSIGSIPMYNLQEESIWERSRNPVEITRQIWDYCTSNIVDAKKVLKLKEQCQVQIRFQPVTLSS